MAEILVEFDTAVVGPGGGRWVPRACGRLATDGLWEGWIEFMPADGSALPARTPRETEQANRDALLYWAQGLTQAYLEEALRRAIEPPRVRPRRERTARPYFDQPAPHRRRFADDIAPRPVLDPFEVYRQGESVLVGQLSALDTLRLRDIVVAFGLADPTTADGETRDELAATILAAAQTGGTTRRPGPTERGL